MSIEFMNNVWKLNLEPSVKFVFITLADCCDHQGQCFPSIRFISERTGYSESTVHRAISDLEEKEYLKKEKQVRKNGSDSTNKYTIINTYTPPTMTPTTPTMTPPGSQDETPYNHHLDPSSDPKTKKTNKKEKTHASRGVLEKLFESLYIDYPLKKSRQKALEAFIKINPDESMVEIMRSALRLQMRERAMLMEKGLFAPNYKHLATWLNQRCWLDEIYDPNTEQKIAKNERLARMQREITEEQQRREGKLNGTSYRA